MECNRSDESAPHVEENGAAAEQVSNADRSTYTTIIDDEDRKFIEQLCTLDPVDVVDVAKTDASLIEQLEEFSVGFKVKLEQVKKEKALEDENARRQERQRLADGNACFECGKVTNEISECLCFEENGVNGHGVRICHECLEVDTIHLCSICLMTLCDADCGIRMCYDCSAACCTSCINMKTFPGWKICDTCDEFFCSKCSSDTIFEGCGCANKKTSCISCRQLELKSCRCGNTVCSDCERMPLCGKDVVLCEMCFLSYLCEGCDCYNEYSRRLQSRHLKK
jgi:hypothetical protein